MIIHILATKACTTAAAAAASQQPANSALCVQLSQLLQQQ
jgi:hypothetical protein